MDLSVVFSFGAGALSLSDLIASSTDYSITVTHPDGHVDVEAGTSSGIGEVSESIDLRTDSDGEYLQGDYVITYTNEDDPAVNQTETFTVNYTAPTVVITPSIDYVCSSLTSTDSTSYSIAGGVLIDSTRTHTVSYPNATGLADVEDDTQIISISPIYSGEFTTEISTDVTWTVNSGQSNQYSIGDVLTGTLSYEVDKEHTLCELRCCLKAAYDRWQNAKCNGNRRASQFEDDFIKVASISALAQNALNCGNTESISAYVAKAKDISDCDDCNCNEGAGSQIVGLCGSVNQSNGLTAGDGITITLADVIEVDETWLTTFVNDLISDIDENSSTFLTEINNTVSQNSTDISTLQQTLINEQQNIDDLQTTVSDISAQFANHRLCEFHYKFRWDGGTLTDNTDSNDKIVPAGYENQNSFTVPGFVQAPEVSWVSSSSYEKAKLTIETLALDGIFPSDSFNNVRVQMTVSNDDSEPLDGGTLINSIEPQLWNVQAVSNGNISFDVYFLNKDTGTYFNQYQFSQDMDSYSGVGSSNLILNFIITGENV